MNRYLADQPGRDTKRPAFGHQVRPEAGTTEGPYDPSAATRGVDTLTKSVETNGIKRNANVFAELGSTWRFVMRDPTTAAHLLGKLLKHIGEDNVLWGTDSIWYGSPQDQIQAFRSFEIYIVVAAIYLALALAFSALFKLIYQRALNYPDRR